MKPGKREICNICRKDVVRNRFFLLLVGAINLMYILVHFLPGKHFDRMLLSVQALYVMGILVMIPLMLYGRCGGVNRQIIKNVVLPKIHFDRAYFGFYYMWVIVFVLTGAFVTGMVICLSAKGSFVHSVLFFTSVLILVLSMIQLGIVIFSHFEKYVLGFMVYFLCMVVLLVINAPDSFLWIVCDYEDTNQMLQYWFGKIVLLVIAMVGYGVSEYRMRGKKYEM